MTWIWKKCEKNVKKKYNDVFRQPNIRIYKIKKEELSRFKILHKYVGVKKQIFHL